MNFQEWITRECRKLDSFNERGGQAAFAKLVGESSKNVSNWVNGADITLSKLESILKIMGGDVSRALPCSSAFNAIEKAPIYGKVTCGVFSHVEDSKKIGDPLDSCWRRSKYSSLILPKQYYVEVEGDSMLPMFCSGQILVCGEPNGDKIPNGCPVVAQHDNEYTCKIWSCDKRGNVVLQPINREYEPIVGTLKTIRPYLIVLGSATVF